MLTRILAIAALLVAGVAGPVHAAKYKIKWLLGHKNLDYFEEAAASFKAAVEAGSKGEIEVQIVTKDEDKGAPSDQDAPEIAAAVAKGEAEMGHSFTDVMGGFDRRLWAFESPYLFRGYRHMEGVIEGPVGEGMLAGLRERGIVGLSFTYSGGSSGVATKGRALRAPADLKGLKVGVYGDKVNEAWLRELGAVPVAIEHRRESILPLAKDGSLDAVVITWRNFEQAGLHQAFKHYSLPGSTYLVSVTYINEKFYDSLPETHRALLRDASKEAGRIERAKTIELNEDAKRLMLAKGVRAVPLNAAGKAAFAAALKPADARIEALLGAEFVESVRRAPDGRVHPAMPKDFAVR